MKKFAMISLIGTFVFASIVPVASANYGEHNRLTGYVKEYRTLIPLADAKVKLYKKNGSLKDSDKTNFRGKYHFRDLSEGTYRIRVEKEGFRNPQDARKNSVRRTFYVDGTTWKNLYLKRN